jgi:hypothetical protein
MFFGYVRFVTYNPEVLMVRNVVIVADILIQKCDQLL